MTPIFLDIEVLQQDPAPWMVRPAHELRPPANYRKPETIEEWRKEAAENQVRELRDASSLCPDGPLLGGTICAFAVAIGAGEIKTFVAPTGDEAGERWLLAELQKGLCAPERRGLPLITYNGNEYDLPFIARRALRHGLCGLSGRAYNEKPWNSHRSIDLMVTWRGPHRSAKGRLVDVARFLGIEVESGPAGSDISDLWAKGKLDDIASKCAQDVRILREVYWWFRAGGWVSGVDPVPERVPRPVGGEA